MGKRRWRKYLFRLTAQAWIAELGLYHYKARFYSPTLGRFLQTNPIGYDDQINLYAYVGNDPINATDPTGERLEMTYHRVAGTSARHAAVRYTPEADIQSHVENLPSFQNVDADGNRYAVISAGPEQGSLVSRPNRQSDIGPQEGAVRINIPDGRSEVDVYNDIARADAAYNDRLDYDLFPAQEGQESFFVADDGYNSNSFVSGLLEAAGLDTPQVSGVNLPSYDKPAPPRCFERGNSC